MALSQDEIRRLGRAAGENTATGAYQRLEQAVANFRQRNDGVSDTEVNEFRSQAERKLYEAVVERFPELRPA